MTDRQRDGDPPSARRLHGGDDAVLPFRTERSGVEGRIVRLAAVADDILGGHDYPEPVSRALGEALALTAMLGAALKPPARLILEIRSDGPLKNLAVNYEAAESGGRLRGYAGIDASAELSRLGPASALLGAGQLVLTIEPGAGRDSYQGVVAFDGGSLSDAARAYFLASEQLPTLVRLAVAREFATPAEGGAARWMWRVGGLMIQHLGIAGHDAAVADAADGDIGNDGDDSDDGGDVAEHWRRVRILAETVEDHELIDPLLAPERLLLRLFHEEGVRVRSAVPLGTYCRCSRERIAAFIGQFSAHDLADLREPDGSVVVTCEFCGKSYRFAGET